MATTISTLITRARKTLLEATAKFWTDAELLEYAQDGIKELWREILDLHQEHFQTIDITNVSLAADATSLTGVPADVFRVSVIEPRDLTSSGTARNLTFEPRDYNHPDFVGARSLGAQDPNGATVFYTIMGAGAPVAAPTVVTAPKLNTAVNLRFVYVPTLASAALAADQSNPIPGESDLAVIAWIVAYARAKEREDRTPDPEWLTIYSTERSKILTALTPRQTQEPDTAEAFFEQYWGE